MYLQLPVEGDNLNSDSPVCQRCRPAPRFLLRHWRVGKTHQGQFEDGAVTRGPL